MRGVIGRLARRVRGYGVHDAGCADHRPAGALVVEIVGHQWWWEVRYPDEGITTANELHIPVGRPIALQLTSADVIHSFWVPALGGKMDLLPDTTNTLVLQADEPGEHHSQCAEFCGLQHADHALIVVAEPAERFASWVADQQHPALAPEPTAIGSTADAANEPDLTPRGLE